MNWCATASVCVRGGLLWFSPTIAQDDDFFILIFNNDAEIYSQSSSNVLRRRGEPGARDPSDVAGA